MWLWCVWLEDESDCIHVMSPCVCLCALGCYLTSSSRESASCRLSHLGWLLPPSPAQFISRHTSSHARCWLRPLLTAICRRQCVLGSTVMWLMVRRPEHVLLVGCWSAAGAGQSVQYSCCLKLMIDPVAIQAALHSFLRRFLFYTASLYVKETKNKEHEVRGTRTEMEKSVKLKVQTKLKEHYRKKEAENFRWDDKQSRRINHF